MFFLHQSLISNLSSLETSVSLDNIGHLQAKTVPIESPHVSGCDLQYSSQILGRFESHIWSHSTKSVMVSLNIYMDTLETCKNPRPTSGRSELPKSCKTSTMNFHMMHFSWKIMPGWSYPVNFVNENVILFEISYWRLHMARIMSLMST